ncbi:MAG: RNA polymerase sporulation sigma factor SigG [Acutalibacteraceae bacterium]|nr:RNA polymerase sporulation sigma factor SigG [Acutalibacteraceae bacterium]
MFTGKVEICGVDTSKLKVLKEKEKEELLRRFKNGDSKARDELVMGNLRLVLSVVQRFSGRGENMDDLFQVGCIGLIKSIENFDVNQNVRFSTYAVPMIIGEIRRHLRDNNPIRVSRSVKDTAYKAMKAKEEYINKYQREPRISEIAQMLEISESEVVIALESIVEPISLYEPVFSEGGDMVYVLDQLGDNSSADQWIDEFAMRQAIHDLDEREKNILTMRFMRGMTQTEVSKEIGISQAQVSRLEKNAIDKIKGQ